MSAFLVNSLATTDALSAVFEDESVLQALLDVEAAIGRVLSRSHTIPAAAARAITGAARSDGFRAGALAAEARMSGTVVIPLVKALTERVRSGDPDSAGFVHWGVTSQDVSDTALVLLLRRARLLLAADAERLTRALVALSEQHAGAVMLGRTLLQPAPPITFGLKAAGWYAGVHRSWGRLSQDFDGALIVQCGGASGTLAALGEAGLSCSDALAVELGLGPATAPWHTQRDRLAAVVASCGILVGALGKMARDITLLMQAEIGEAAAPGGGSSTMPHKRNPSGCAIALAAATRAPNLVATFLSGMVQEHERSVGGWHAEWPTIAAIIQATGSALAAMAGVAEGLTIDAARMRANITATGGVVFSEKLMMLLAPSMGRDQAHRLVGDAVEQCQRTRRLLVDVLRDMPAITAALTPDQLAGLDRPEDYIGLAEPLRVRLLKVT
jgi:3-carboxy-cis,cis-muconate cycloisomerase